MNIIPLFIAIPLGAAFILVLLSKAREVVSDVLVNLVTLCLAILSLVLIVFLRNHGIFVYTMGRWFPPKGINLVLDGLSLLMLIVINLIAFFATLYSVSYMKRFTAKARFYSLFMLMIAGMNGVVLTGDFFNLFVFLEIASIASYALVAFGVEAEELEAAFKYMVMSSVASVLILFSIGLLYGLTGSLNMADISGIIKGRHNLLLSFSLILFLAGFGLKAAIIPFHAWLPDAHPSAPAPISAMLSGVLIKALGIYTITRIFFNVYGMSIQLSWVLLILGIISMIGGGLLAIRQSDFKRLLAYSSISQIGYILVGLGCGNYWGIVGALFHLFNHATFKSLLFLNSGAVEYSTGTRKLEEMGGLSKVMPVTGATSTIGCLSISGVPPFNGFWSKLFIIIGLIQAGHIVLTILTVLVSVLTLAYYLKVQRFAFFGRLNEKWTQIKEVPGIMCISMIVLAIVCISAGILFYPLMKVILDPAVAVLQEGTKYSVLILGG
ncbi:MAG TPA: NADH/ubiquinone/plastoquinone (complex I) [Candidatus Aerophobetes bacterium]|uniref:NADH/ubiquinone/plastoquinone (Complex I) n=1 Tax=Aerophobetes bacterium TaxID=2030807 RepID=A0A7V0QR40_UNCAE|nr:NADH/ubiquinone/plastoquinone (complex I) [Candidatus Aerophobetes bacterium]